MHPKKRKWNKFICYLNITLYPWTFLMWLAKFFSFARTFPHTIQACFVGTPGAFEERAVWSMTLACEESEARTVCTEASKGLAIVDPPCTFSIWVLRLVEVFSILAQTKHWFVEAVASRTVSAGTSTLATGSSRAEPADTSWTFEVPEWTFSIWVFRVLMSSKS